jgi:hypothetical protein
MYHRIYPVIWNPIYRINPVVHKIKSPLIESEGFLSETKPQEPLLVDLFCYFMFPPTTRRVEKYLILLFLPLRLHAMG